MPTSSATPLSTSRSRALEMRSPSTVRRRLRVALYSHDALGLGHMRRNLLIAESLSRMPLAPSVLLLAGSRYIVDFHVPDGVDCLTLPSFTKKGRGRYVSGRLAMTADGLRALRASTLAAALTEFRPDLLIVDKVPLGVLGELEPTLAKLRAGGRTKCVLGLRDILDDPDAVRAEWCRGGYEAAIRDYYDDVWIYGDPAVYDALAEYGFGSDFAAKATFTGYLDPLDRALREASQPADLGDKDGSRPLILCQLGGGQDGGQLAEAFAQAEYPGGARGLILTGPQLSQRRRSRLSRIARSRSDLDVIGFSPRAGALLQRAGQVVSMGGYNSLCEALSLGKPTLVVPRVRPRAEQLLRARRFSELGLLEMVHPDLLSPHTLSEWMEREPLRPVDVRDRIDFEGLRRLSGLVGDATADPRVKDCVHVE